MMVAERGFEPPAPWSLHRLFLMLPLPQTQLRDLREMATFTACSVMP